MTEELERRTFTMTGLEVRATDTGAPQIVGYAAVFDSPSQDLGGFTEIVKPGAFTRTLKKADVRALFNHNPDYVLGRTKSKTLKLMEDAHGLMMEVMPPDQQWSRDLMDSIKRGDIDGMSFAFYTRKDNWYMDGQTQYRELLDVELDDVSVVTYPAYPATQVGVRSLLRAQGIDYEALSGICQRSAAGQAITADDSKVIKTSIDALNKVLERSAGQGSGRSGSSQDDKQGLAMLDVLEKQLDLARLD